MGGVGKRGGGLTYSGIFGTSQSDFQTRLDDGLKFERVVSTFLESQGFPIGLYLSREDQWRFGESRAHLEIKHDKAHDTEPSKSPNLFIEIEERRDTSGLSQWRPAGIYDASDPWFYLIGGTATIWLLNVRYLRLVHSVNKYPVVMNRTETAKGMLYPTRMADSTMIRKWIRWPHAATDSGS